MVEPLYADYCFIMMESVAPSSAPAVDNADATPFGDLLEKATALRPWLWDRAEQTERERRVSNETTQKLIRAGVFRVVQPRRFGGFELGFAELHRLAFEIGRGCASTGWCYGIGATGQWMLAMFPEQAQIDVWGQNPDALAAGCVAPTGNSTAVDGGYHVKGRWGFASNCDNADWIFLGAAMQSANGATLPPAFMLLPRSQCRIDDTWFTSGLAGTGSKDIVVDDPVFVPEHRSVGFARLLNQQSPGSLVHNNSLYRLPFLTGFPWLLTTPAIAALRGALDEFENNISKRTTRGAFAGGGVTIAQHTHVQTAVAEAEAAVDAANLIVLQDIARACELVELEQLFTTEQRISFRRNQAYVVRLCTQAIDGLYDVVGGSGISLDSGVQRAWRDIHAIAHHVSLNWNTVATMYGQMRLGLEPRGQY